jgi:hypothetical protein
VDHSVATHESLQCHMTVAEPVHPAKKLAKVFGLSKESTITVSDAQSEITELSLTPRLEKNQDGC